MVKKGLKIKIGRRDAVRLNFSKFGVYLIMVPLAFVMILPLIYVVGSAFKPLDELIKFPPVFFVRRPTLNNFSDLFLALDSSSVPFLRYLFNSLLVTVAAVAGAIIVDTLGGYSLSKLKIPFKGFFFNLIIIAMAFPTTVTAVPNYTIIKWLGIYDTYFALIIPLVAGAFGAFLIKQFCDQLPVALLEAARIDGATELQIYMKIVMPFLRPAWATLSVFCFTSVWSNSTSSLLYIKNETLRTLPVMLASLSENGNVARAGASAAASFIMLLPSVVIFIIQQRKMIDTMAHSGIK